MTTTTFSTPSKILIRQKWAKPLLQFIHDHLNQKLLYLGLPGPEAEDVYEWIDYLHIVFAFQNEDDRYPNAYQTLFDKLDLLEEKDKIKSFSLFDGFMERVIMEGIDNQNNIFNLNELVTVYNLDYCSQIDFPIESQTLEGEPLLIGKFDSIKRLLEIQNSLKDISCKFVLFLTIHCSYKDKQTKQYFDKEPFKSYIIDVNKKLKGKGHEKNARSLRLYIIHNLNTFFNDEGFAPEFLPTIFYEGIGGTPMILFTVIGTKAEVQKSNVEIDNIIKSKFIVPNENDSDFINQKLDNLDEIEHMITDSVEAFKKSDTFIQYWKTHKDA